MPCLAVARQQIGHRAARWLRCAWFALLWLVVGAAAQAQGVEVLQLAATRGADAVALEYQLRVALPRAAEEAAQRGVPIYFAAQATLWRNRWYWRDERIARERREWRLSYQPLTSSWRVSQGGLGQSFPSLAEALASFTQSAGWRLADASAVDSDGRYYVEFDWRLETALLPRPLQIGITGVGGAGEWALSVERSVRLAIEAK